MAEYNIHNDAHQPLYRWTETGSQATHTREVTKTNLFALEAEGQHILTAGAKQAVIYQVRCVVNNQLDCSLTAELSKCRIKESFNNKWP